MLLFLILLSSHKLIILRTLCLKCFFYIFFPLFQFSFLAILPFCIFSYSFSFFFISFLSICFILSFFLYFYFTIFLPFSHSISLLILIYLHPSRFLFLSLYFFLFCLSSLIIFQGRIITLIYYYRLRVSSII